MWKYAEKVTMSMKSKYVNGTIVTIFRENVLILAIYWQLGVCDNFDNFLCDIFYLGNILAASLWQFFVWQFWSWQHTGSGLVTGTYGGYWTQCGNTMGSTPRTLLHWNNIKNVHLVSLFYIFVHYFTFSSLFLHENTAKWVLATDFTKQIHLRKKLLALLLYWATSISYKARPGKRFKKVLFKIKVLKSFVYNQSA